jgi:outer membrane protein TolC
VAAERLVLAAFRNLEAARRALLPAFTLTLDGGRLSDALLSLVKLNPWFYHAALGMTLPIYTGGQLTAQVKIDTAQQQQAVAHYGGVVLNAFDEVETALTNENLYGQQFGHLENSFREYSDSVRIATIKYKAGTYDMQQVLQLQTAQLRGVGRDQSTERPDRQPHQSAPRSGRQLRSRTGSCAHQVIGAAAFGSAPASH